MSSHSKRRGSRDSQQSTTSTSSTATEQPASTSSSSRAPAHHRRINPASFSFTPMRQPPPPSPLSQPAVVPTSAHTHEAVSSKNLKKVHILHPDMAAEDEDAPPCFIHSGLDKHGSLQDWLRGKADTFLPHPHTGRKPYHAHRESLSGPTRARKQSAAGAAAAAAASPIDANAGTIGNTPTPLWISGEARPAVETESPVDERTRREELPKPGLRDIRRDGYDSDKSMSVDSRLSTPPDEYDDGYDDDDEEDEEAPSSSLTRQLAATAQGVREVSKELGRTTVHSRIQHILIVTKARDNGLIRLTRELALYLMLRELPYIPNSVPGSTTDLARLNSGVSYSSGISERSGTPSHRRVVVYVDGQLRNSKRFDAEGMQRDYPHLFEPIQRRRSSSSNMSSPGLASSWGTNGFATPDHKRREEGQLRYWTADMCSNSPQLFDFVVTLGGDGTVLFTSWLFQKIVPPVLPFALGSLGFLTNFDFKEYRKTMDRVINEGIRVNLRMRFTATVYRAIAPEESIVIKRHGKRKAIRRPGGDILVRQVDKDGWDSLEGGLDAPKHTSGREKEIMCFSTRPVEQFEVLNDLVVDRGPSPFVSLLEVFGDDHHLTTVQADGLTVSTPTGSTAYSLSAGGSLVHPQIPALLLTPICPHTLSFRPMLLPDSMELRVCVPYNSRSTAWASFDGRGRIELKQGDHIKITASKYPFPTVCADKQSTDWFSSISRTLRWNERERQKSFVVVEEEAEPAEKSGNHAEVRVAVGISKTTHVYGDEGDEYDTDDEDEDEDFEEFEEEFDIDDRSGGDETPSPSGIPPPNSHPQRIKSIMENAKSGVNSPDRFASGYRAPPPLSQRHLLERLATVENQLRQAQLDGSSDTEGAPRKSKATNSQTEDEDEMRTESDATLYGSDKLRIASVAEERRSRSESTATVGESHTPRQGRSPVRARSRNRNNAHSRSRSHSPAVGPHGGSKSKAFAFFGQDDSTSELSDHSF